MLIQLIDCTVTYGDEILFNPEDGPFDMAIGSQIVSAYAGAADHDSFPNLYEVSRVKSMKPIKSSRQKELEDMYARVREIRTTHEKDPSEFQRIYNWSQLNAPDEWLLLLELYEICADEVLARDLKKSLNGIGERKSDLKELINSGLEIIMN